MYRLEHSLFVTGTDTEVGKTFVSCQLLRRSCASGLKVAAWKPVAAGCHRQAGEWRNEDGLQLQQAAGGWQSYAQVNPVALPLAASPHIAAAEAGQPIELPALLAEFQALQAQCPRVLVEGAGGWLAPISAGRSMADLACALQLPVLLVVGMRLGCLNHAQLTARAVIASGLVLEGWIANCIEPDMPYLQQNIDWLQQQLPCPLLERMEYRPA